MLAVEATVETLPAADLNRLPDDVMQAARPRVLEGLAADWPLVKAGDASPEAALDYLGEFDPGATVGAFFGDAAEGGRVFYNADMTGFNYQPVKLPLKELLAHLRRALNDPKAPMMYLGSTTVDAVLPGLRAANDVDIPDQKPLVSIWLGNRSRIAAHHDLPDNLAVNAAGRRRFILFPPDQLPNLYVGPIDFTPAGQAISLVDFHHPDLERFPRFAEALASAQVAELAPGDAIYIPSMWWHHVESLDTFNVLINYWWRRSPAFMGQPMDVLLHALLTLRDLPADQRQAWQRQFEHYVFESEPGQFDHIPEHRKGVLSELDDTTARQVRAQLLNKLNR
ncbi:MAG: cupin-like domain-containing protein [Pseudomonadota bacterium]